MGLLRYAFNFIYLTAPFNTVPNRESISTAEWGIDALPTTLAILVRSIPRYADVQASQNRFDRLGLNTVPKGVETARCRSHSTIQSVAVLLL